MKAYTDLDQSKKLAEILPIESADMCWTNHCYGTLRSSMTISAKPINEYKNLLESFADLTGIDVFYPAWSLAALLSVLNCPDLTQTSDGRWYIRTWYLNQPYSVGGVGDPVDACVEMIIKLHEHKML